MLILDNKEVKVRKTDATKSGYQVYLKGKDGWEPCYTDSANGYFRVWMGSYEEAKVDKTVNFYYQHIIVYAYYCGWNRLYIMPQQVIHHMDHNKQNNKIENLICMNQRDHRLYHICENKLKEEGISEEEKQNTYSEMTKILSKWLVLRDRALKKNAEEIIL